MPVCWSYDQGDRISKYRGKGSAGEEANDCYSNEKTCLSLKGFDGHLFASRKEGPGEEVQKQTVKLMISEEIKQYLIKVCTILNSHNVQYMVVGGAAVSHYGFNRPSGIGQSRSELKADLDFWYNPTVENYQNLVHALEELEIDTSDLKNLVFDRTHTFLKI